MSNELTKPKADSKALELAKAQDEVKEYKINKSLTLDYPNILPEQLVRIKQQLAPLNLPLNKALGLVDIIPYGKTYQVQVSVKGYETILAANKAIKKIDKLYVYDGQVVRRDNWQRPKGISGQAKSTLVIGYVALATLPDGTEMAEYMSKIQATEYGKKYSKTYKSGPWQSEFDKMAMKSCVKQLIKKLPMVQSTQLVAAMNIDQAVLDNDNFVYADNPNNDTKKVNVEVINDSYDDIEWDEPQND